MKKLIIWALLIFPSALFSMEMERPGGEKRKEFGEEELREVKRPRQVRTPSRIPLIYNVVHVRTNDNKLISIPRPLLQQFSKITFDPRYTIEVDASSLVVNELIKIMELHIASWENKELKQETLDAINNIPDEYIPELNTLAQKLQLVSWFQLNFYHRIGKFLAEHNDPNTYTIIARDGKKMYVGTAITQLSDFLAKHISFNKQKGAEKPNEIEIDQDSSIIFPIIKVLIATYFEEPIEFNFDLNNILETIEVAQRWELKPEIKQKLANLIINNIDADGFTNLMTYPKATVKFFLNADCLASNAAKLIKLFDYVADDLFESDLKDAARKISRCLLYVSPTSITGQEIYTVLTKDKRRTQAIYDALEILKKYGNSFNLPVISIHPPIKQFGFLTNQNLSIIYESSLHNFELFQVNTDRVDVKKIGSVRLPIQLYSLSPNGRYCTSHQVVQVFPTQVMFQGGIWDLSNGANISQAQIHEPFAWSHDSSRIIKGYALYAKGTFANKSSVTIWDIPQILKPINLRFEIPGIKKFTRCLAIAFMPDDRHIVALFSNGFLIYAKLTDEAIATEKIIDYRTIIIPLKAAPEDYMLHYNILTSEKFIAILANKQLSIIPVNKFDSRMIQTFDTNAQNLYGMDNDYLYLEIPSDEHKRIGILDLNTGNMQEVLVPEEIINNPNYKINAFAINAARQQLAVAVNVWKEEHLTNQFIWSKSLRPILWQIKLKSFLEQ